MIQNSISARIKDFSLLQNIQTVLLNIQLFWDVMLCWWSSGSQCLKGLYCLHLQGHAILTLSIFFFGLFDPAHEGTLILEQVRNLTTKHHIPEDLNPQHSYYLTKTLDPT
jgi:hypothetical protein